MGSDTLQNNILWGLVPRLTKSWVVSDLVEQSPKEYQTRVKTFKYEYLCEFETECKNILGCEFGDYIGLIRGKKTKGKKSRATVPFKRGFLNFFWKEST